MQMTEAQFMAQISRLSGVFGDKAFSFERMELIRKYVADVPAMTFGRVADHMIATFRTPPLPRDFADCVRAEKNHKTMLEVVKTNFEYDCLECHDLGYLLLKPKDGGSDRLVRHNCLAAKDNSQKIPEFSRSMLDEFTVEKVPAKWFVPGDKSMKGIWEKVEGWKKYIQLSEAQWGNW